MFNIMWSVHKFTWVNLIAHMSVRYVGNIWLALSHIMPKIETLRRWPLCGNKARVMHVRT